MAPARALDAQEKGANNGALAVKLILQRVDVDANGLEHLVDVKDVRPGDLLEYRAIYTNHSPRVVGETMATLPIPQRTQYQPNSARPAHVEASRDGTAYGAEPLMERVRGADGKEALKAVPYTLYRSLRWKINAIKPEQSATVRARVRVDSDGPAIQVEPGKATSSGAVK